MIIPLLATLGFFTGVLLVSLCGSFGAAGWIFLPPALMLFKRPKVAAVILLFLLGGWRVAAYEEQQVLDAPIEQYVQLEGEVVEEVG